jgi:hypothetical protein
MKLLTFKIKKPHRNAPIKKIILTSVIMAREALAADGKMGCCYRRAKEIYVVTAYGSGTFSIEDWGGFKK